MDTHHDNQSSDDKALVPSGTHDTTPTIMELHRSGPHSPWTTLDRSSCKSSEDTTDCAVTTYYEGGIDPEHLHSFVVHSPHIRKFLGKVLADYAGICTTLKHVTFSSPFHELYHQWERYIDLMERETDDTVLAHICLLHGVVEKVVWPVKEKTDELLENGVIDYDHLWVLFPPNTDVVSRVEGGHY